MPVLWRHPVLDPAQTGWLDQALVHERLCSEDKAPVPRRIRAAPHLGLLAAAFRVHPRSFRAPGPRVDRPGAWRDADGIDWEAEEPVFLRHLALAARGFDLSAEAGRFLVEHLFDENGRPALAASTPGLLRVGPAPTLLALPAAEDEPVPLRARQRIRFAVLPPDGFDAALPLVLDRPPGAAARVGGPALDLFGPLRPEPGPEQPGPGRLLSPPVDLDEEVGPGTYALLLLAGRVELERMPERPGGVPPEAFRPVFEAWVGRQMEALRWALVEAAPEAWRLSLLRYEVGP